MVRDEVRLLIRQGIGIFVPHPVGEPKFGELFRVPRLGIITVLMGQDVERLFSDDHIGIGHCFYLILSRNDKSFCDSQVIVTKALKHGKKMMVIWSLS